MKQEDNNTTEDILSRYENLAPLEADAGWESQLYARITAQRSVYANKNIQLQFTAFIIAFLALNSFLFFKAGRESGNSNEQRTEILNTVSDQLLITSTALK